MIKILHLNINGLRRKANDLKALIVEEKPGMITLNETKLTGNMTFSIDGYTSICLLYTSPSPRDGLLSRMPSSA